MTDTLRLRLVIPTEILVDAVVRKVLAEGPEGSFCLLPRHIDCAAVLVPGLLAYETTEGVEHHVAIDDGILVKCADEVLVSTRRGVAGGVLGSLRDSVADAFAAEDEHEYAARTALLKLEGSFIRRFLNLGGRRHE